MHKFVLFLIKAGVLVLVIGYLMRQTSAADLVVALSKFTPLIVIAVAALIALRFVLIAVRIKYATHIAGINAPFTVLLRWEYEILFLELVFPVPDAEDIFRLVLWQKINRDTSKTLTAILFSRVCGLLAVAAILPFTITLVSDTIQNDTLVPLRKLWMVSLLIVALTLSQKKILKIMVSVLRKIKFTPHRVTDTLARMAVSNISGVNYATGGLLSFLTMLLMAAAFYILVIQTEASVTYMQFFAYTPIYVVAFMLPLSIQGLGVPETVLVWFLPYLGVDSNIATAIGIVHFICYVAVILFGAVLVLSSSDSKLEDLKKAIRNFRNKNHPFQFSKEQANEA